VRGGEETGIPFGGYFRLNFLKKEAFVVAFGAFSPVSRMLADRAAPPFLSDLF
jgi:hypothetical protein